MRIIGIDPGSLKTGYGIIDIIGNQSHYVASGTIRVPAVTKIQRLKVIFQGLTKVIEEYRPEEMSIEEAFFARNAKTALLLGQVRGVAIITALNVDIEVYEYAPRLVKKAIVGTGAATKEQINFMVQRLLGLRVKLQEDAADALALALCHSHQATVLNKQGNY